MSSNTTFSRNVAIAVTAVIILAVIVVPPFLPGATHEAQGTITHISPAAREVSVEIIDPANGTTREFTGVVAADCAITINGRAAQFADLRVEDSIHASARIEHGDRGSDGKKKNGLTAERIDVTRPEGGVP